MSNLPTEQASTIHGDRRQNRRYELELDLSYVVHTGNRITLVGSGRSANVSSSGLLFRAGAVIEPASTVIGAIRWPLPSLAGEPMLLVVSGRVIWGDRERTALAISRHEFMPEAQYHPTDLRSILPLRMISPRAATRRAARTETSRSVVLVVDSDDRQGILAKLLESYGYLVQYAERGRAVDLLDSGGGGVDILVTNDMNGFERFAQRVPIILTMADGAQREPSAELARRVIRKPFVFREIVSAIQELSVPAGRRAAVIPMRIC
jgi:hypothetical protein